MQISRRLSRLHRLLSRGCHSFIPNSLRRLGESFGVIWMRQTQWKSIAGLTVLVLAATPLQAAQGWIESLDGDLSNDGLAPTIVTMGLGANTIAGTTGNPGTGIDRDFLTFTVPDGTWLSSLIVKPGTTFSGSVSFIGIQLGTQIVGNNVLAFALHGPETVGTDLLPTLLGGVNPTLASGNYTVWIQETGGPVSYGFDFVLTPVPEPTSLALLATGVAGIFAYRRRQARSAALPQ